MRKLALSAGLAVVVTTAFSILGPPGTDHWYGSVLFLLLIGPTIIVGGLVSGSFHQPDIAVTWVVAFLILIGLFYLVVSSGWWLLSRLSGRVRGPAP